MKPKRTTTNRVKSAEIEIAQRVKEMRGEYPTLEEIYRVAGLLAASRQFSDEDTQTIASRALDLWDGCRFALEERLENRAEIEPEVLAACEKLIPHPIPKAEKFPAPLDEWLQKFVGGKYVGDRERLFRDFLRTARHLDQDIGSWKAKGLNSEIEWEATAIQFQQWRKKFHGNRALKAANSRWAYGFRVSEITDLPSLANKLKQQERAIDKWLFSKLPAGSKAVLESFQFDPSDASATALRKALVKMFNGQIRDPSLGERQHFKGVNLRPTTRKLFSQNPKGDGLTKINRLLLEDAYPQELSRKRLPKKNSLQRKSEDSKPV